MPDEPNKQDKKNEIGDNRLDKTNEKLRNDSPEPDARTCRQALAANPNRTDTVSPDGVSRFGITDNGKPAGQEQVYEEKFGEDPSKPIGHPQPLQEKSVLLASNPEQATDKTRFAAKAHEKAVPKDGQELTVKQLLYEYKTPFIEAYEHSKKTKEGEPGKSKTLENIVDRLKACPWSEQIRIKFDSTATNPDYNNEKSRITILPQDPPWKQIDTFAHEGYHATHQTLKELYAGAKAAELSDFLRIKGDAEVGSFEAEVRVHSELKSPGIVSYEWTDAQKHPQPTMNLGALYASKGRDGLAKFILFDAHTDMEINKKPKSSNYHHYHESRYGDYVAAHPQAHKSLMDWFQHDPTFKKKVLEGNY